MTDPSQLSARQQELLARELERRKAAVVQPIQPRPPGEPPPLSLAQRRLWFLDRIAPGRATYNATLTMRIEGPLHVDTLRVALDLVVRRHEALRTVGVDVDGEPVGKLLDEGARWRSRDIDEAELPSALAADAREPFDLTADVMLRGSLYRLGPDRHVLILVMHHIACDGWSRGVLFDEIAEIYNAAVEGRAPRLPELKVQYGDYAKWQVQQLSGSRASRSDEFWRKELEGADVVLDLPVDFPRAGAHEHLGERVAMDGEPGSGDAFRALARGERTTYFMAMMAATGALLSSLSGQEDVVLGSPVANRQQPELEGLIGFFVNTLILRVRLEGDLTFRELLGRCRTTALACLAHQDTPLDRVVEVVNPRRVPGRNPLFQVNFRMQGKAPPPPQLTGLVVTRMLTDTGSARFDLAVGVNDEPGALRGYIEYTSSLFRATTAQALQATFVDLVAWVTAEPDVRLSVLRPRVQEAFATHKQTREAAAAPAARSIRRRS